jgi:hypothetical protein
MSDGKNKHYGVSVGKVFVSDEWDDWKRAIMEINNSYDAVWLLVPYDIYLPNGELVDLKQKSQWLEVILRNQVLGIIIFP